MAAAMMITGAGAAAASGGFSGEQRLITASAAPHDSKYTQISWGGDVRRSGCGIPLSFGNRLLLPQESSVLALSESSGAVTDTVPLPESCSQDYAGARIDYTLLQPTENGVCLIDTESMKRRAFRSFEGKTASDCAMIDDMGYLAVEADGGYEFVCIDLKSESLDTLWSVKTEEQPSAAAVQGDNIIFSAGSSIYTHDYKNDSFCEIPVGKEIVGSPFATQYSIFFSTADGNAGKLRLNADGTLEEDTLTFCKVGGSPSSPLSWNGRLYVAADDGLYILDDLNMEVTYTVSEIKGGCTPQVHYGSGPYIYTVAKRENRWAVYCVLDMDDESEPAASILAQMEDYTGGAFCASDNGTLYFRDAFGRVYALNIAPFDILALILRLVVVLALIVLVFFWLKKIAKRRADLRPKF